MPALDNAHALMIGIADYQQVARLPAVQDAQEIAALLVDPARGGYPPAQVRLLRDAEATRDAVQRELDDLVTRAAADATVVVFFSGHGGRIEAGPHAGDYLLPVDADPTTDATLAATAIAGATVTEALRAMAARRVLVIFDCCHAGGIGQPRDVARRVLVPGLSEGYYDTLRAGRGRVIMASSRGDEFSYVPAGATYGLFTGHLLAGLRGGAAREDGLVRIFDLFEYVQPRVTNDQPTQHPLFKAELEDNFPIARAPAPPLVAAPAGEPAYRYDAYVSYVDREPDATWVWETLLPRLQEAGLRVAVSNDSADPGVARVVGIERGLAQAKRTVVVLSNAYLDDHLAAFENVLAQGQDALQGTFRLLPVTIEPIDEARLPWRLRQLVALDLVHPRRAEREFERLITALRGPLPHR
jgi:hypothetical protein